MKCIINMLGVVLVILLVCTPLLHGYLRVYGPEFLAGDVVNNRWGYSEPKGELTAFIFILGFSLFVGAGSCFIIANTEEKK